MPEKIEEQGLVNIENQRATYIPYDPATGQVDPEGIINVDQITKKVCGQRAFWKLYLFDFLAVLGIIDSKQLDVLIYIMENTNSSTNLYIGTFRKIATDTGVSLDTVRKIMKKLQENSFLQKVQNGVYGINPNIMMKGNENKRQILLSYQNVGTNGAAEISYTKSKQPAIPTAADAICALTEGEGDKKDD